MSVKLNDENNGQQAAPAPAETQNTTGAAPQQPVAGARRVGLGLGGMSTVLGRPIGRNNSGVVLSQAHAKMKEMFEADKNNDPTNPVKLRDFTIIPIDHKEHRLPLSLLAIALPWKSEQATFLAVHYLILEGSDDPLPPGTDDYQGRRYEVTKVASDILIDQRSLLERVRALVVNSVKSVSGQYIEAGFHVIPRETDLTDEQVLRGIAFYATNACITLATEAFGLGDPFNVASLAEIGAELEINPEFQRETIYTTTGMPTRLDARLRVASNAKDADGVERASLTDVGAQVSLVYTRPQGSDGFSFNQPAQNIESTRCFTPVISLVRLDTDTKAISLELQNLGLLSAAVMTQDLYWLNAFRRDPTTTEKTDMRNTGALPMVLGMPRVETHSASFSEDEWVKFMGALCHEQAVVAIDIEDAGEMSWMNSIYAQAAAGDIGAARVVHSSFNNLTNGNFIKQLPASEENLLNMFIDQGRRLLLGYWIDSNGDKRDLREIDFLYVLNATGNVDTAMDYQDTFDDTTLPITYRLERRQRILEDILGSNNVKIKGTGVQLILHPELLAAAARAVEACQVSITRTRSSYAYGKTRVRGNNSLGAYAAANQAGGLFQGRRVPTLGAGTRQGVTGYGTRRTW